MCNNNITLEFYSMELIKDVSILQDGVNKNNQEFLFDVWWHHTRHPNVIFHQATNVHDVCLFNTTLEKEYYKYFFKKLANYTTRHSVFYFFSNSPAVCESKVPMKYRQITTNSRIFEYNNIISEVFPNGNKYIKFGLNLQLLSSKLGCNMYEDGVHNVPSWYRNIAQHLIKQFCSL